MVTLARFFGRGRNPAKVPPNDLVGSKATRVLGALGMSHHELIAMIRQEGPFFGSSPLDAAEQAIVLKTFAAASAGCVNTDSVAQMPLCRFTLGAVAGTGQVRRAEWSVFVASGHSAKKADAVLAAVRLMCAAGPALRMSAPSDASNTHVAAVELSRAA